MKHIAPLSRSFRSQSRPNNLPAVSYFKPDSTPLDLGLPKEKLLLTIPETARLLQVSCSTIRNLIDCGALVAGHVGISPQAKRQCLRITRQSIEHWQKERFGG